MYFCMMWKRNFASFRTTYNALKDNELNRNHIQSSQIRGSLITEKHRTYIAWRGLDFFEDGISGHTERRKHVVKLVFSLAQRLLVTINQPSDKRVVCSWHKMAHFVISNKIFVCACVCKGLTKFQQNNLFLCCCKKDHVSPKCLMGSTERHLRFVPVSPIQLFKVFFSGFVQPYLLLYSEDKSQIVL